MIVGTRPEVIKMAPLHAALKAEPQFDLQLCATGQHSDLLKTALDDFGLMPDFRLDIMEHGQSLGSLTSKAILGLEKVIQSSEPNVVLVHGDTTTTLAASLAAFYTRIPLGHVEAGLRTGNFGSPFPEELNRTLVGQIARWNFAPTKEAVGHLLNEGISHDRIHLTGNTIVDSLRLVCQSENQSNWKESTFQLERILGFSPEMHKTVLITTHRRENLGDGVKNIFEAVSRLSLLYPDSRFVLPLHPNQEIRNAAAFLGDRKNVRIIDPLNYKLFILLISKSHYILTDSGGIQEESVTLGKRVLVARDSTERPEGMGGKKLKVVGSGLDEIESASQLELGLPLELFAPEVRSEVFGDGHASKRIVDVLRQDFLQQDNGKSVKNQF
jgi:UDP-N-acetylglucosamine 2-epimerase (non-hydrolysing)